VAHANSSNSSLYGSVRGTQGPLTAAFSGRFYGKSYGYPSNPAFYQFDPSLSPANDEPTHLKQQTYGLTITYAATARWQHHLTLGYDHSGYDTYLSRPLYTTPADTFVWISTSDQAKTSVAYNTTYDVSLGRAALASLTAGADHWIYLLSSFYASGITRTNNVSAPASVSRSQYNNSGYFSQAQLGLWDAVYVTAGLRAEDNQNVGQSFGLAWAPRVGVAYVRTVGDVTAKARVAYGKAIRPPSPARAQAAVTNSSIRLANPGLAPEQQVGPDGGLELYFGQRGSLEASYYHQTADNLIDIVDLAVSPKYTYQYQNVGKIKNDGWEFQGRLNSGRFSLTGTYSITTSKVQKLSPNYTGAERPGDQMLHTPRHTAGATLSYIRPRTTATLGMTSVGSWTDVDYVTLYGYYYAGQPYRGSRRAYWTKYSGFTKFNLSVSQTLTDRLAVFVRSDNLTNRSVPELNNYFFTAGRTTMIGMRVKP